MNNDGSFEHDDSSGPKVYVRYKFKNDEKEYKDWITMPQFRNFQSIPIIEYCIIISK